MSLTGIPLIVLWIHLLAAVTWIGGIIFLALMSPTKRYVNSEVTIQLRAIGRRFRDVSWIMVGVLIITGMANLAFLGLLGNLPALLVVDGPFKQKMIVVGAMMSVKFLHDFIVGPRATSTRQGGLWWKGAFFLGRLNLALGLGLLYLALQVRER